MVYLAVHQAQGYTPVREIAQALAISGPFLSKVFQQLVQAGLVESHRGPTGGVRLSHPPKDVTLKQIVVAIDGPELFTECVLGLAGCGQARPCPVHEAWTVKRSELDLMFKACSLEAAAASVRQEDRRLAGVG